MIKTSTSISRVMATIVAMTMMIALSESFSPSSNKLTFIAKTTQRHQQQQQQQQRQYQQQQQQQQQHKLQIISMSSSSNNDEEDEDEEDDEYEEYEEYDDDDDEIIDDDDDDDIGINIDTNDYFVSPDVSSSSSFEDDFTREELQSLTIPQLKQQLRLRGLKVGGVKADLIKRLWEFKFTGDTDIKPGTPIPSSTTTETVESTTLQMPSAEFDDLMLETETVTPDQVPNNIVEPEIIQQTAASGTSQKKTKAQKTGKPFVDVTPYLDPEDIGKQVRSSNRDPISDHDDPDETEAQTSNDPEVWGQDAKIVDDYEGRSLIVDNLSRCVVEFRASNQSICSAFVVASRDALKAFVAGGGDVQNVTNAELALRELQLKREQASYVPTKTEEEEGADQDDDEGYYENILQREYSDWGKYTATGAQLSSNEVQGVLLLSDVYGPFNNDTRALAEKIAFECQPVVVMVPDMFRSKPWEPSDDNPGFNHQGQSYEKWRAQHDDLRVSVDIRAAAACLRERYGVSSIAVWGTCYGGARALEAASSFFPDENPYDVDGEIGPPPVDPMACIAWYPTRYNVDDLFGYNHKGYTTDAQGNERSVAVMAVFAGKDVIPGATPEDAAKLKAALDDDYRVKDYMVKVFPNEDHGFAHIGLVAGSPWEEEASKGDEERFVDNEFGGAGRVTLDSGEAEVACLLSTAWMETYSRVFLPTTGPIVSLDENEAEWQSLEMKDLTESNHRDVRKEIEDAVENYKYDPTDGGRKIDRFNQDEFVELKEKLMSYQEGYDAGANTITEQDDLITAYEKLRAWDPEFQLF